VSGDERTATRSAAVAASRRWARRVWLAQLAVVVAGFTLLVTTDAGLPVVAVVIVALLGVHLWARRSLGRELAELGRPDAPDAADRPDASDRPDAPDPGPPEPAAGG
jgi:ABC-type xylose transport system permease subunit